MVEFWHSICAHKFCIWTQIFHRSFQRTHAATIANIRWSSSAPLVALSPAPGASVAHIAREHGVNANQVFSWRRLYQQVRLGVPALMRADGLLQVVLAPSARASCACELKANPMRPRWRRCSIGHRDNRFCPQAPPTCDPASMALPPKCRRC